MPALSHRAQSLPASAIRKFMPLAADLKRQGIHIFHLNIGQPDIPAPASFFESVRRFDQPVLAYEPSAGAIELRQALSDYYARLGISVGADEIIVTAGGSEALMMAMAIVGNPGDEIIVPEPFYTNDQTFAAQQGVVLVPFPTRLEENFAVRDLERLESLITPRTKALLLCSPNNPTGAVMSRAEMEAVARVARERDLFVISDEVYREFVYEEDRAPSWLEMLDFDERLIVIDSASKRYSVCGARIGWLVSRRPEIVAAALKCAQARLSVSTLEQAAVAELVRQGDGDIQAAKQEYDQRRRCVYDLLQQANIPCGYPAGALYLLADVGVDAESLTQFLLTEYSGLARDRETVLVTPARSFYRTPGQGKTQIRIAFVLQTKELERAIKHLIRGIEEFRGKPSLIVDR